MPRNRKQTVGCQALGGGKTGKATADESGVPLGGRSVLSVDRGGGRTEWP